MKQKNFFTYLTSVYALNPVRGRSASIRQGKLSKGMTAADGKAGVYRIFEDGKCTYIGSSKSNVKKTILRHFQNWKDQPYRTNYDVSKKRYVVEITIIKDRDPKKVLALEEKLIDWQKPTPRDNNNLVYGKYNHKYKDNSKEKDACFDCYQAAKEDKEETKKRIDFDDIPF